MRLALVAVFVLLPISAFAQATWTSGQCGAGITLSNGNKTATHVTGSSAWRSCYATTSHTTGKYYFEISVDSESSSLGWIAGIMNASGPTTNYSGSDTNSIGIQRTGGGAADKYYNGAQTTGISQCTLATQAGAHVGFAIDIGNKLWCTKDGTNWYTGGSDSPVTPSGGGAISGITGAVFPSISLFGGSGANDVGTLFTQSGGFSFSIPSGYAAWDVTAVTSGSGWTIMK